MVNGLPCTYWSLSIVCYLDPSENPFMCVKKSCFNFAVDSTHRKYCQISSIKVSRPTSQSCRWWRCAATLWSWRGGVPWDHDAGGHGQQAAPRQEAPEGAAGMGSKSGWVVIVRLLSRGYNIYTVCILFLLFIVRSNLTGRTKCWDPQFHNGA